MKKNYSLFAKLGALAMTAAVGLGAYATFTVPSSPITDNIWTEATQLAKGDQVTFVGFNADGSQMYQKLIEDGSKVSTGVTTLSDAYIFNVIESEETKGAFLFEANRADNETNHYLMENGSVKLNSPMPECEWKITSDEKLQSVSNGRYLYYDEIAKVFQTTQKDMDYTVFKKADVARPTIECANATDKGHVFITSEDTPEFTVTSTEHRNGKIVILVNGVEYLNNGKAWDLNKDGDTKVTVKLEKGAEEKYDIKAYVQLYTSVKHLNYAKTGITEATIQTILLNNPIVNGYTSGDNVVKVNTEGKAVLSLDKEKMGLNLTTADGRYYIGTTSISQTTLRTEGTQISSVELQDYQRKDVSVYARAMKAKLGDIKYTDEYTKSVTVQPNLTVADADAMFGNITYTIDGVEATAETKVGQSQTVVISCAKNTADLYKTYTIKVDPTKVTAENATVVANGATIEVTTNADFVETSSLEIKIAEGAFYAVSGNTYYTGKTGDVNNINYYAKSMKDGVVMKFAPKYATKGFDICVKDETPKTAVKELEVNNSESYTIDFTIYPFSGKGTEAVDFETNNVKITDSENVDIVASGVTVERHAPNTFTVTIPAAVVNSYLSPEKAHLLESGFMVSFEKGSLNELDSNNETVARNNNVVTGFIKFYEQVRFDVTAADWNVCRTETDKIEFDVKGIGLQTNTEKVVVFDDTKKATITNIADATKKYENCAVTKVDGKYYVALPEGIAAAANYNVTFAEGTFTAIKSKNAANAPVLNKEDMTKSAKLHVYAHPKFEVVLDQYDVDATVLTFKVQASNSIEKEMVSARTEAPEKLDVVIGGKAYTATRTLQATNELSYSVTTDKLSLKSYEFVVKAGQLQANLCKNAEIKTSAHVKIQYIISREVYKKDTEDTNVDYYIAAIQANENVPAGQIEYKSTKTGTEPAVTTDAAFNNGRATVYPTITKVPGEYTLTVDGKTYPATKFNANWGSKLEANNYQINFPEGTLSYDGATNLTPLVVNFNIANHIKYVLESEAEVIDQNQETLKVWLRAYDTVDKVYINGNNFSYIVNKKEDVKVNFAGKSVAASKNEDNGLLFEIKKDDLKALKLNEANEFTLTTTEGNIVVYNTPCASADPCTVKYLYAPVWVASQEITVDEADELVKIPVVSNAAEENIALTLLDYAKITVTDGQATPQSYTLTADNAYIEGHNLVIKNKDKAIFKKIYTAYTVVLQAGAVKSTCTALTKELKTTVKVVNHFDFNDCADYKADIATKGSDVKDGVTYDKLTYYRNFTGKMEAMVLPFDINYDEVSEDMTIYKVITIAQGEVDGTQKTALYVEPLKTGFGVIAHAGMPYIVKGKVADDYTHVFTNIETKKLDKVQPLSFSSTVANYVFNVNYTDGKVTSNMVGAYRMHGGALTHYGKGKVNYDIWRWNIEWTGIYSPEYIKVVVDGFVVDEEGEATGIQFVPANEDANNAIYNLNGQKLNKAAKGVNIVNGKKVLVK